MIWFKARRQRRKQIQFSLLCVSPFFAWKKNGFFLYIKLHLWWCVKRNNRIIYRLLSGINCHYFTALHIPYSIIVVYVKRARTHNWIWLFFLFRLALIVHSFLLVFFLSTQCNVETFLWYFFSLPPPLMTFTIILFHRIYHIANTMLYNQFP